jgi:hypothetical protein
MMFFLIYSIAVIVLAPVIFGLAALPLIASGMSKDELMQWLVIGQDFIVFFVPMAFYFIAKGKSVREVIPFKRLSLKNAAYVVAISLLMMPIMAVISQITDLFVDSSVNDGFNEIMLDFPWWVSFISMAILPPFFEESMFRGFILTGYKRSGFVKAVVVSALFFGMMHLDLYQLPYATFAGIMFASLVYYTGSIWASMLAHFVVNGSQTVLFIISAKMMNINELSELETYSTMDEKIAAIYSMLGLMIVTLPFLLFLLNGFVKRNKQSREEYCGNPVSVGDEFSEYAEQPTEPVKHSFIDKYFVLSVVIYALYMYVSKCVLIAD